MLVCLCMVYQIGIGLCVSVFVYGISDRNRSVCLCMVYQRGICLCVSVLVYGISERNRFVC